MALLFDPKYSRDVSGYREEPDDVFQINNVFVHDPEKSVKDGYVSREFLMNYIQNEEMWQDIEKEVTFCHAEETYGFNMMNVSPKKCYCFDIQFVLYREPNKTWTRHIYINEEGMTEYSPTFAEYYSDNEDTDENEETETDEN